MSSTQMNPEPAHAVPGAATVALKLEVVVVPVSDVERAKGFYQRLGWRLDADFAAGDSWRVIQMTPPASPCSILFGKGLTTAQPGSLQGLFLIVDDIGSARAELLERGVEVSEVFHFEGVLHVDGTNGRAAGPDPQGRSYMTWASFSDPDGNNWLLQEIKTRLPGRGLSNLDVANLTQLLRDAETKHGAYEPTAPKHHWSDFYAAYIVARQQGRTSEEAVTAATRQVEGQRR